jgi:uncharacterized membrane protein YozB (DUF420 family)
MNKSSLRKTVDGRVNPADCKKDKGTYVSIQNGQRRIAKIRVKTRAVQAAIEHHALYERLNSVAALQRFMEHHVYAVWDFMSLLKALQNELTCTQIPWRPIGDSDVRRFVNDIVHCEESDKLPNGRTLSHFELYLEAMHAVGANTTSIEQFIELIDAEVPLEEALDRAQAPQGSRVFVTETFEVINSGNISAIAAAFTFGREQALPSIFHQVVRQLERSERRDLSPLVTYLDRHIEVDGGDHGWLAEKLLCACNGDDAEAWASAQSAAESSLMARLTFWDAVLDDLPDLQGSVDGMTQDRRLPTDPKEAFWMRMIIIVSVVVSAAVGFLIMGPRPDMLSGKLDVSALPLVNSCLNALTFCLLIWGVIEIKRGALRQHQRLMLSAFGSSALFLVTYVIYHWNKAGPKLYEGDWRGLYLFILVSHILLAIAILPMAMTTLYRGWIMDRVRHRQLAKWTFPVWLYVSVTGVVIYVMAHT